jgi:hypothetical protein
LWVKKTGQNIELETRDRLLFWSVAGAAAFNRDPAILSNGLTRCVVRLQEEPPLERALERPAKIIKT